MHSLNEYPHTKRHLGDSQATTLCTVCVHTNEMWVIHTHTMSRQSRYKVAYTTVCMVTHWVHAYVQITEVAVCMYKLLTSLNGHGTSVHFQSVWTWHKCSLSVYSPLLHVNSLFTHLCVPVGICQQLSSCDISLSSLVMSSITCHVIHHLSCHPSPVMSSITCHPSHCIP